MSNRNFDSRTITDRLQQRNHARYVYDARARGNTIISNPQTSNGNASTMPIYHNGTQTVYFKGLLGGNYTVEQGGPYGIPLYIMPESAATIPGKPVIDSITPGNQQLTVLFSQGEDGGSSITNYEVSINNGTYTPLDPSQISSPIFITGLTNGTTYSVKIRAINAIGTGPESTTVTGTPVGIPGAPTLLAALPSDGGLYIYFTAGSNGGSAITNYEYSDDGVTWTEVSPVDVSTPLLISGLTNGVAATLQLRAVNLSGPGASSNALTSTPQVGTVETASLYYDPNEVTSYSGSGSIVSNIGSAGTFNGTNSGGVSYQAGTGISRNVFRFNGTDYVSYGQYNLGTAFTISAWIYPRNKTSINGLFTNTGANQAPLGFKVGWNNWTTTNLTMLYEGGNGVAGNAQSSVSNTIVYDQWQHVAYLLDQANRLVFFVRNGVPANTASYSTNQTVSGFGTNNSTFRIGTFTDGSYGMNAELGYLKVFSGLSPISDILAEYEATKASFGL